MRNIFAHYADAIRGGKTRATPVEIMAELEKGMVKWFNNAKGYGFITRSNGDDLFFHHTALEMEGYRTIEEETEVEFEVEQGPKGPAAVRVKRC